jgi:hypothetical protein
VVVRLVVVPLLLLVLLLLLVPLVPLLPWVVLPMLPLLRPALRRQWQVVLLLVPSLAQKHTRH